MPDSRILRFNAPPTWPTPDIEWQSAYGGWKPKPDWTPTSESKPAPANWTFWSPLEPAWSEMLRKHRSRFTVWIVVSAIACLAGIGLTVTGYQNASPEGSYVVWTGLIVFSFIALVRNLVHSARVPGVVMANLERTAPQRIEAYNRARYAAYLKQRAAA